MISHRLAALIAAFGVSLSLPGVSGAGIYVSGVSPARIHPGQVVRVQIAAGLKLYALVPLYIVAADRALRPHPCGSNASCEPKVAGPSAPPGYLRVGLISFRKQTRQTLSFTLPRLPAGRYEIAFYCAPCYKGSGGSLVATPDHPFTVLG